MFLKSDFSGCSDFFFSMKRVGNVGGRRVELKTMNLGPFQSHSGRTKQPANILTESGLDFIVSSVECQSQADIF